MIRLQDPNSEEDTHETPATQLTLGVYSLNVPHKDCNGALDFRSEIRKNAKEVLE